MSKSCRDSQKGTRTGSHAYARRWSSESNAREDNSGRVI